MLQFKIMNYTEMLEKAMDVQDIDIEIRNLPFNIYMKNTGDILRLCFMEFEDDEVLLVSETTAHGTEEIRVVPKGNIEYIGIFYDFQSLKPEKTDKMII